MGKEPSRTGFSRILVANRGEIALRIMRACRELRIGTVAVYSEGEERGSHVRYADDAYRLPSGEGIPYLSIEAVLDVARRSGAEAVHPGYGFLSENAAFARAVADAGLAFIGPPPDAIAAMGDKVAARALAQEAGVEPVPGTAEPVSTVDEAREAAGDIGYPVAVKASGGGGGRGFRVARNAAELPAAFDGSRGEAERYFSNAEVYLERYLEHPRHVEVQVFADTHASVAAFPERDCSIQRRHQKLIEESPSPAIDDDLRARLRLSSIALARGVGYLGAGTVEYLLSDDGSYYFLEMNTRIQVEHTITEMVTGIDLVREQILVAAGQPMSFDPDELTARGWAIECRVNAEDAGRDFAPAPGQVVTHRAPTGFGVRVDAALDAGDHVLASYDSLVAKVIGWGRNRSEAIDRLRRALEDYEISGVPTTIPFHINVLSHPVFLAGDATTTFLADHPDVLPPGAAVSAAAGSALPEPGPLELVVELNGRRFNTAVHGLPVNLSEPPTNESSRTRRRRSGATNQAGASSGATLTSPLQGTVIRVAVATGDQVEPGDLVCVVEAMKMENELLAHAPGTVAKLHVSAGSSVSIGAPIADIESADAAPVA